MSDQTIQIHDVEIRNGVTVAGRYEIRGHLGAGGFAQVFEAFDTNIERPVAIKFLNLHATQTDQGASDNILARFKREAKLAARIQHPNVVNIFDFGVIGQNKNIPFIVMEMLSGHDLEEQIFEKGPMKPDRALPLFIACLEALGEAHKADIVHKDLKPSNLFLSNPGTRAESLRIVDFGIAHIQSPQEGRLTATGEILGTPQYLPPEYIESQLVTPAYDIYQMGLILVEALTGAPVVDDNHPLRCVKTHSMGELDLPQPLLESPLGPIVARALHLDHAQRYTDAEAFADALSAIDPSTVPMLGPDTPTARLTQTGTLDSGAHVDGPQTGQMRQPTTGQFSDEGAKTRGGFVQHAANQQGQRTVNPNNATEPMNNSTQAAIAEAGIGKTGIKALALLIVAVLVLGGVAAWLLVTRLNDDKSTDEPAAVAEAVEDVDGERAEDEPPEAEPADSEASAAALAAAGEDDQAEEDEAPKAEKTEEVDPIKVKIASSTAGAIVYRGDDKLGTAPVNIEFDSADDEPVDLDISRRGYQTKTISVGPDAGAEVRVELERDVQPTTRRTRPKPKPKPKPEPEPEPEPSSQQAKAEPAAPKKEERVPNKKEEKKERQRMLIAP